MDKFPVGTRVRVYGTSGIEYTGVVRDYLTNEQGVFALVSVDTGWGERVTTFDIKLELSRLSLLYSEPNPFDLDEI